MTQTKLNRREIVAGGVAALALPALPAAAQSQPELSFMVLGDWGRGGAKQGNENDKLATAQRDVAAAMTQQKRPNFILTVGDNFYPNGVNSVTDKRWDDSFVNVYQGLQTTNWYPALGNHDHETGSKAKAQLDYNDGQRPWKLRTEVPTDPAKKAKPYAYYYKETFPLAQGRSLDVFILDTSFIADPTRFKSTPDQQRAQKKWFEDATAASKADWKIAVGHHPVFSSGEKQSRRLAYKAFIDWMRGDGGADIGALRRGGVHAYFAGHDHHLEHVVNDGVTHILSGAGSESMDLADSNDTIALTSAKGRTPGSAGVWKASGFVACDIAGDVMTVRYLDKTGAQLGSFPLTKPQTVAKAA